MTVPLGKNIQIGDSEGNVYSFPDHKNTDPIADKVKKDEKEKIQECFCRLTEEQLSV